MKAVLSFENLNKDLLKLLIERLQYLDIEIKGVVSHRRSRNKINEFLPNARFYAFSLFTENITWQYTLDLDLFNKIINPILTQALPMTERYPGFGTGSIESVNRLLWEFTTAKDILDKIKPDIVLFFKEPESALEFMLYKLCKHFNIRTLMTRSGLFTHSRTVADNFENPLLNKDGSLGDGILSLSNDTFKENFELHPKSQNSISEIQSRNGSYQPIYMQHQNIDFSFTRFFKYYKNRGGLIRKFGEGIQPRDGLLFKYRLYRKYNKLSTKSLPNNNGFLTIETFK